MEAIDIANIPTEVMYKHPVVQELLDKIESLDLDKLVKIPYIMKNKILMSPGVWNGYYYGDSPIQDAFLRTDWNDKSIRSLFLDHLDGTDGRMGSLTWIGEVLNPHMEGNDLIADLVIVDKATAIKLEYGAKMGISPRVSGNEDDGNMVNYKYDNFSVVINPAVKTAYINNSQKPDTNVKSQSLNRGDGQGVGGPKQGDGGADICICPSCGYTIPHVRGDPCSDKVCPDCGTAMVGENIMSDKESPYGDVPYADPGYQEDKKKRYPLDTESHVRAAWSYINMPKNQEPYTAEQVNQIKGKIRAAAKKHGISIKEENKEVNKMSDETPNSQEQPQATPQEQTVENADAIIQAMGDNPLALRAKKIKSENSGLNWSDAIKQASQELSDEEPSATPVVEEKPAEAKPAEQPAQKPVAEEKPVIATPATEETPAEEHLSAEDVAKMTAEKVSKEMSKIISTKDETIQELSQRLEKVETKLNEPARKTVKVEQELSQLEITDPDQAFLSALQSI